MYRAWAGAENIANFKSNKRFNKESGCSDLTMKDYLVYLTNSKLYNSHVIAYILSYKLI